MSDQSGPELPVLSPDAPPAELLARAADEVARGLYEQAQITASMAEAKARQAQDSTLALRALVVMGDAERRLGRLEAARRTLDSAVPRLRTTLGVGHPATRDALLASAALELACGRPAQALGLLEWTSGPVDDLGRFVEALVTKADAETALDRPQAAEATIALAQAVAHPEASPRAARATAAALSRGARRQRDRKALAEAGEALSRAQQLLMTLSSTHPDLADVLEELGSLTADRGDPLAAAVHWSNAAMIADVAGDGPRADALRRRATAAVPPSAPPAAPRAPAAPTPPRAPGASAPPRAPAASASPLSAPVGPAKAQSRPVTPGQTFGPPPRGIPAGFVTSVARQLFITVTVVFAVLAGVAFSYGVGVARSDDRIAPFLIGAVALGLAVLAGLMAWSDVRRATRIYRLGRVVPATVTRLVTVTRGPRKRLKHFTVYVAFEGGTAGFGRFGREVRATVDLLVLDQWALLHVPGFSALGKVRPPARSRG
jgi:tetratricopeptide (TPR) repeat protein